jgi:uncharacterized membrane protein (DUF106 family)
MEALNYGNFLGMTELEKLKKENEELKKEVRQYKEDAHQRHLERLEQQELGRRWNEINLNG